MTKYEKPTGPEEIQGVNMSQFSIARHYGGIVFNGQQYTYFPENGGTLVRDDVLRRRAREAKKPKPTTEQVLESNLLDFINGSDTR